MLSEDDAMSDAPDETSKDVPQGEKKKTNDLGGRRQKADRRGRTTAGTFPERRWLRHRRDGGDRRSSPFFNPREEDERRKVFKEDDPEDKE
jgi:hypothetical protein